MISIVTVTYDDPAGLARTRASLVAQTDHDFEWIVVAGEDDLEVDVPDWLRVKVLPSERSGIYTAMNAGLQVASGSHVAFLNGGDRWVPEGVALIARASTPDDRRILGFDAVYTSGDTSRQRHGKAGWYLRHGLPTIHQSIVYPAAVFEDLSFSPQRQVCADYELTCEAVRAGFPYVPVHQVLASFEVGGTSFQHPQELDREARFVQREVLHSPWPLVELSSLLRRVSRRRLQRLM